MKKNKLFKNLIFVMTAMAFCPNVFGADMTIDYIKNQAFENRLYNNNQRPEPTVINLFSKKSKENKKTPNIEVEYIDENANITASDTVIIYENSIATDTIK